MSIKEKISQKLPALLEAGESLDGLCIEICSLFDQERKKLSSAEEVKSLRDRWLGRKNGLLAAANDNWLKVAPQKLKPQAGRLLNETRKRLEAALEDATKALQTSGKSKAGVDVTLPGPVRAIGAIHPVRLVEQRVQSIFHGLGYSVAEGPEIESFYYNFEALNFPADHPAVDEMDTIFVKDRKLLRTHTSPIQIRVMEQQKPPLRYQVYGKVYRHDTPDSTHSPMFHQMEGFVVDEKITFCDLKGTLNYFLKEFFGSDIKLRFRPSFFPFTEPSAEVDISCIFCVGRGCRICKQTGFIELLGCGMIDPTIFRHVGYDPERYSGFAFGVGLDRIAMLSYDINDIQLLFQGDIRFLRQFQ